MPMPTPVALDHPEPLSHTTPLPCPTFPPYRYREAEVTHGRVAMLAVLGFLVSESFHPFFGGEIDGPAIYALGEVRKVID